MCFAENFSNLESCSFILAARGRRAPCEFHLAAQPLCFARDSADMSSTSPQSRTAQTPASQSSYTRRNAGNGYCDNEIPGFSLLLFVQRLGLRDGVSQFADIHADFIGVIFATDKHLILVHGQMQLGHA